MDSFNYRIVKTNDPVQYAIHEAYYDKDDNLEAITEEPVYIQADTKDGLMIEFDMMCRALTKPVIDGDKI